MCTNAHIVRDEEMFVVLNYVERILTWLTFTQFFACRVELAGQVDIIEMANNLFVSNFTLLSIVIDKWGIPLDIYSTDCLTDEVVSWCIVSILQWMMERWYSLR